MQWAATCQNSLFARYAIWFVNGTLTQRSYMTALLFKLPGIKSASGLSSDVACFGLGCSTRHFVPHVIAQPSRLPGRLPC